MPRPKTKEELVLASKENYEKLNRFISQLSEDELQTPFDFSRDPKKKEAHWKRDKNLRDVLIHLYEWHQLLLTWVHSNQEGLERLFLPEPYNWKTYGEMNVAFWKKHQKTSLEEATRLIQQSHREVLELIEVFSNDELFTKGVYKWTGGTSLGSYFVSSTSSHYDWALKKFKAHQKNCKCRS
ncbi:ClbS/DfsB family four-helix bundle protein [Streptococcus mitis]|uniref:DinB superfamily protein n=1 Tax=Streptococcus mitis TaxID=28037 RepID=A0A428D773_STRMT|nr:ClbS/DfsB family four-helix bundle protein [Streptococcus mitis]RSI88132.1 DinB superfamily protein [Streptococcus mitis]